MEATNTNILVFDLIRSGLDPYSIAQTWSEHVNHYTTAVDYMRWRWSVFYIFRYLNQNLIHDLPPDFWQE